MKAIWTEEMISDMMTLLDEGKTATETAKRMSIKYGYNLSRCAILGKRMRIRNNPDHVHAAPKTPKIPKPKKSRLSPSLKPRPEKQVPPPEVFTTLLMDVRGCRYTKDGKTFCNEKIYLRSCCPAHYDICYTPSPRDRL